MLIPVRLVVDIWCKPPAGETRRWYSFYKDSELPISIFHAPHIIRLQLGSTLHDFGLDEEKLPLCIEGVGRVVLRLKNIADAWGTLLENLKQYWPEIDTASDAEDFIKTPEAPKAKKPRAKKIKAASKEL